MLKQSELKSQVYYDTKTGYFSKDGKIIRNKTNSKYLRLGILGKMYRQHRLAWLYVYGEFPNGHIDHIDHDTTNNAISNLRDVTASQNQRNASLRKDNKSGWS